MKKFYLCILTILFSSLCAADPSLSPPNEENLTLHIHNKLLTTVNGIPISVMDVAKKMDVLLHTYYPEHAKSKMARFQFYSANWKEILADMVHTELMLADAEAKEVKVTDAEVHEELESRFGPNVIRTLEELHLSYDEALKHVKTDLIVKRMSWFFVNSKALNAITPQVIREGYKAYLSKNPPKEQWKYQILSIGEDERENGRELAQKIHDYLKDKSPSSLQEIRPDLDQIASHYPSCSFQISDDYEISSAQLSESHKSILQSLKKGTFSPPTLQQSRLNGKTLYRIFFLKDLNKAEPASFKEMAPKIKDELLQKAAVDLAGKYRQELRRHYNLDDKQLAPPETFQPFSLE